MIYETIATFCCDGNFVILGALFSYLVIAYLHYALCSKLRKEQDYRNYENKKNHAFSSSRLLHIFEQDIKCVILIALYDNLH